LIIITIPSINNIIGMLIHTTNYYNTLIVVAEDCPVTVGEAPTSTKAVKTVAEVQYDILIRNPYKYTSDEILFQVYADRKELTISEYQEGREAFFSKGQPCFRTSPLTKRFGFGIHADKDGKIALWGMETKTYEQIQNDANIIKVKAMRNSKK
jgi:hypothetical protein